jgi:flagellar motor switch protein FliG
MSTITPNMRKAAVLIRSLDAATAAGLLAQLPPEEVASVRTAMDALGPIDPDERADVAAEIRLAAPVARAGTGAGVELAFSSPATCKGAPSAWLTADASTLSKSQPIGQRFDFLERAPISSLVPYLAREHVQTIAVVLSHLPPARAAAVLAALPPRLQADALERLSVLGESDPDSLKVVEQELAAWVAAHSSQRRGARSGGAVDAILAAADTATRDNILANVKSHKRHLAGQLADSLPPPAKRRTMGPDRARTSTPANQFGATNTHAFGRSPSRPAPAVRFEFDDLLKLGAQQLAGVLGAVDANVLVLALAGSGDDLVERIAAQMPKRTGKEFRRRLRKLGPTRLSDVEAAQQAVARAAAERLRTGMQAD